MIKAWAVINPEREIIVSSIRKTAKETELYWGFVNDASNHYYRLGYRVRRVEIKLASRKKK